MLVTGSRGFIGRHVMALGRESGYEMLEGGRDSGWFSSHDCARVLADVNAVIHLAGRYPVQGAPAPSLWEAFDANAVSTALLLDACARSGLSRVVLASSANVYCPCDTPRQSEKDPTPATSPYATSKLCAETLVRSHGGVVLRLFNVYGPGQERSSAFVDIARQTLRGERVRIFDDRPVRDFVFVTDVARALITAASRTVVEGSVFNVGTGRGASIGELARLILQAYGLDADVEVVGPSARSVDAVVADPSRIAEALGWTSVVTLERGVRETLAAMQCAVRSRAS